MKTKDLCKYALIGALLFAGFVSFSNILYVEIITFLIVLVSLNCKPKTAIYSIIVFSICLVLVMGVQIFTIMYLFMYVFYAIVTILLKKYILKNKWLCYIYIGVLSFATGQFMDLPFIIFSKKATIIYILMGLKTSLIQGSISFLIALYAFDKCQSVFKKICEKENI